MPWKTAKVFLYEKTRRMEWTNCGLSWKVVNSLASSQESQVNICLILRIWTVLLVITAIKFQNLKAEYQDFYITKSVITNIVEVQMVNHLWSLIYLLLQVFLQGLCASWQTGHPLRVGDNTPEFENIFAGILLLHQSSSSMGAAKKVSVDLPA